METTNWQERTQLLLKKENLQKLKESHVFVAGMGGVGAFAAEMLCRAGVGTLTIADGDRVNPSNRNRQLLAMKSTENQRKVDLMAKRLLDINPELNIHAIDEFLRDERTNQVLKGGFDYVIDAIDSLSPKVFLIKQAVNLGLPLVSSMGAGGKIDPSDVKVAEFSNTYHCSLAKVLRKRLRKQGIIGGFKAVFSAEFVDEESVMEIENEPNKKTTVGTISYMPAIFGCFAASVAIREIIGMEVALAQSVDKRKA